MQHLARIALSSVCLIIINKTPKGYFYSKSKKNPKMVYLSIIQQHGHTVLIRTISLHPKVFNFTFC